MTGVIYCEIMHRGEIEGQGRADHDLKADFIVLWKTLVLQLEEDISVSCLSEV